MPNPRIMFPAAMVRVFRGSGRAAGGGAPAGAAGAEGATLLTHPLSNSRMRRYRHTRASFRISHPSHRRSFPTIIETPVGGVNQGDGSMIYRILCSARGWG
jgi:hypothetical protein